jgi:glycosyltransferase involved in cell wall biosynthesis
VRILVLKAYPPYPPQSGGQIRTYELLRCLSLRHKVTLGVLSDFPCPDLSPLEQYCEVRAFPRAEEDWEPSFPWPMRRQGSPALRGWLRDLPRDAFDVTMFEHVHMADFRVQAPGLLVLNEHNIESELFRQSAELSRGPQRSFFQATWMQMRAYESKAWPDFALRSVCSEVDQQIMDQRCAVGRSIVVPNGVNLESGPLAVCAERRLLFMGTLSYFPNVDAVSFLVRDIMPRVWQSAPEVRLRVAGLDPSAGVRELARSDPRIELSDSPANMRDQAADCRISLVPLRSGSGTRLKILDSFAWGLPVITTSVGCQGLQVEDGDQLLIRDRAEDFAQAIVELLDQPQRAAALVSRGLALAERSYSWPSLFEVLERETEQRLQEQVCPN